MKTSADVWAIVLAAGEGSRLRALTTQRCGHCVPKQFCSLHGGPTLLDEAILRASKVVPAHRICPIVAEQHSFWWKPLVNRFPPGNVIVQPANRGTAIGILYSVMYILARDPRAHVVLLPADHFVREEATLQRALQASIECVQRDPRSPVLLGLEPDEAESDLGYIVPGPGDSNGSRRVQRFVEKPPPQVATALIAQGALWNTFIIAAAGQALIDAFFAERFAMVIAQIEKFLNRTTRDGRTTPRAWSDLTSIYETFPVVDFSRDILAGREAELRVVEASACGWSDLGTPKRVAETLARLQPHHWTYEDAPESDLHTPMNLAVQQSRYAMNAGDMHL